MLTVVLDTNVLVSGLLNSNGPPARILDLILGGQILVAYDDRILGEYEEVLSRPELHIQTSKTLTVIDYLEISGRYIESGTLSPEGYTDRDDVMFAEVFITSNADALVTGNLRHYKPLLKQEMLVLSPAQFLEKFFPER
jgi:putative PIN family toxin of toxin-antitoxin system